MVNSAPQGPFFVTALEDSQHNPIVYVIAIRHGNGGHYLFHDYEGHRDAQERCDRLNEAVAEWVQGCAIKPGESPAEEASND